ncbi:exonuclease SbcC [Clostridium acidisoli DSM 12555]|uniref:Nuclease SbcCD subunit C n=1 Tax=Clostridium acidisoli DSM 12555 TaxID=1121291 RepID=A0A1W1WYE7_9CLOT|nr:SbcC/MukB-like Walker B domain-containing protein [Clostridium acidisoli]SMC16756.1 exonuclease SbcC [Clostridium acidisoli DSM 12555]
MKPIKLKIKGLNSFIESQEINFEKLTDKGLFGIFGPTGSGKSTILDGITLAMYGEVSRKSTNFMNTNCDSLNVSFEFQISSKEIKRYRVEREFKRDNRTESIKSKAAKIIDITNGTEIILEEGAKLVTKKCEEILGLKLEDFTRTVVLPQGKFSEFLKLEGKERRNMLERLFNLQKYGDNLSIKLNSKIKIEKEQSNVLDGELKGYQDISDEILSEKNNDLLHKKEECTKGETELKYIEEQFNKGKELWDLQNELISQLQRENELKEKSGEITESVKKVNLGESALKVKPYIDNYESTIREINSVNEKLQYLKSNVESIKEKKNMAEIALTHAKERKDKELPQLQISQQKVIEAIEEKSILNSLVVDKNNLENSISKTQEDFKTVSIKIEKSEDGIKQITSNINIKDEKIEVLKISEEYKQKVTEGKLALINYNNFARQKEQLTLNNKNILTIIEAVEVNSKDLLKKLTEKEKLLSAFTEALTKSEDNCPGDQNTLLDLQDKLLIARNKWSKHKEYTDNLDKSIATVEVTKNELQNDYKEKTSLDFEIKKIKESIQKIEIESLASTLRNGLLEGEACPVCGSTNHHLGEVIVHDSGSLEKLKIDLKDLEQKYSLLCEKIIKAEAALNNEEKNIEEKELKINALGEDFKATTATALENKFENLKKKISEFNTKKADLEKNLKALNEEKNKLNLEYNKENTKLIENKRQLVEQQKSLKNIEEELQKINKKLIAIKTELGIEDINLKIQEIAKKEREKSILEKEIKALRDNLKIEQQQRDDLNKIQSNLKEILTENKTKLNEKITYIKEKEISIKNKVGDVEDLDKLKNEIAEKIIRINKVYEQSEKNKNETEKQYTECNNEIITTHGKLSDLKERSISDREKLKSSLLEENIKSLEEVKNHFMPKEEIEKLKHEIEEYNKALNKLSGTIESLKMKIGSRNLTEEQWNEVQNQKDIQTKALKALQEKKIKLETEVKTICKKLLEKNKLLKDKEKLDYKLGLLDDLEKLFKGKKFVEFVAANQLKYISIEACKWLKEITCGNYGLEVDENGKFLIRDYKNGGAKRDASTLSGGETFVASLALALALSAQIQLKGTAPLELFFLDEGFGTLDDNLLEVVMDSLEKIHNDKLSIGIISHVEAIKNRVPIKLIVTAAEAGLGGSKVKLERS